MHPFHLQNGATERLRNLSSYSMRIFARDLSKLVDPVLIAIAGVGTKLIYLDQIVGDRREVLPYLVASVVCASISALLIANAHRGTPGLPATARISSFVMPTLTAFVIVIAIGYALKLSSDFSRGWFAIWLVFSLALLSAWRIGARWFGPAILERGLAQRNIAVLHSGPAPDMLLRDLAAIPTVRITDVTSVDEGLEAVAEAKNRDVEDIVICCDGMDDVTLRNIVAEFELKPVSIHILPSAAIAQLPIHAISAIGNLRLVSLRRPAPSTWGSIAKRAVDLAVSAALLLLLSPLFALIAIAIKAESRGPVLFFQNRRGKNRAILRVAKFRTMSVLEDGPVVQQATRQDPRVTRVGRLLRRTSLDELPQLYNVLKGEMSLVGPRPHALAHDEHYAKVVDGYMSRLRVKPGMTGWAQINGFRGPTPTTDVMQERIRHDLEYIENWSIWFDLELLLLTPVYGMSHRNAV